MNTTQIISALADGIESFNSSPFTKLQLFERVFGGVTYLPHNMFYLVGYKVYTQLFLKNFVRTGKIRHSVPADCGYCHCIYESNE